MQHLQQGLERWHGKVALITGASSGIGWAAAHALADLGVRIALTARREERLAALRAELEAKGTAVLTVAADIAQPAGPAQVFAEVRRTWGGIDVLVNNAGLGRREPLATVDFAHLQAMLDVNVRAATLCLREALHDMTGKADAAIINISSLAGHRVPAGRGNTFYAATKHALRAMTEGLRMELVAAGSPVKLGTISPGVVATDFHDAATPGGDAGDYPHTPLQAQDVVDALLYMLAVPRHVQINDVMMRPVQQPH